MTLKDDIARLILQEEKLRFDRFDEADAWSLGSRMRAEALARGLPLVIDIRHRGRPLFYAALPGTDADNPEWVRRKSNVTFRYHRSSYRVGRELAEKVAVLGADRGTDPLDYAPHGGSFPIHVKGTGVVGAVTVSDVPQREDHNFVVEMLCEFLGLPHDAVKLGPEFA
ncbi:MAG: heme-degrading domain-containing protein [Rhizobiales bacterium]|nr:heme-degrading domain-containing protein [Hyphomicrobiales bacterium]